MDRILLIGCGGSGKSTLARNLRLRLGIPVFHLDQLHWQSGWTEVAPDEFATRLASALAQPRWIIDGNYQNTLSQRLLRCDTVVYLDYSRWVCLRRMAGRVLKNWGKTREDMPSGCPERIDAEFFRWVWRFRKVQRPKLLRQLQQAEGCDFTLLIFRTPSSCLQWLASLPEPPRKEQSALSAR